ncbi:hypothetical protein HAX54_014756 [Datura stramonium]|uniref:Pentatricopeptide repeat-containing protein n=1 Tax=Datura stramonium TaxID=4076 RepID=A0ABS8TQP9_DATST|nr:hypothetical protein [Datura stramonium]
MHGVEAKFRMPTGVRSNSSLVFSLEHNVQRVFNEMVLRNVFTWTSMINGYVANGDLASARMLFDLAPERDVVLWNRMITGVVCSQWVFHGVISAFKDVKRRSDVKPNDATLVNVYVACTRLGALDLVDVFRSMDKRDLISWNTIINGLAVCMVVGNIQNIDCKAGSSETYSARPKKPYKLCHVANICGDARRWKDVAGDESGYGDTGSRKVPGCSLIEGR